MRNTAPPTFGARLAKHLISAEEAAWFFNVPQESPSEPAPQPEAPARSDDKVQIGPLDV